MSRTNFKGCIFREREAPVPGLFGLILVDKRKESAFMFLTFVFLLIKSPIFYFLGYAYQHFLCKRVMVGVMCM